MDRISELPQPMLHHILCYLPQDDAVRTCLLSKTWRHLGITLPKIEFRERRFLRRNEDASYDFQSDADRALQRYRDRNLSIQELVLKIFRLRFFVNYLFHLPSVIFQIQSLEELYLAKANCELKSTDKVLFRHLRTLYLKSSFIAEETLNKIFSSCPLIEKVVLVWCRGLKTIKVNEARLLKRFECCVFRDDYSIIQIDTQTLETIRISNYRNWSHHHNEYFPRLKSLCLQNLLLPRKTFDIFSSNFPCLAELILVSCKGFKELQLSSPSIKRLTIEKCSGKSHKIDAPNLIYFEFSGVSPPSPFSFTTTSNELKSRIKLSCCVDSKDDACSTWLLKLNEMLKALTQSHISMNLYRFSDWTKQITEDTYCDSYKPVEVENLIANPDLLSSNYFPAASLNFLFRTCRPRYIVDIFFYVVAQTEWQRENNREVESLCKILHEDRETMSQVYFWLQDLKEASMEVFDENAKRMASCSGDKFVRMCIAKQSVQTKDSYSFEMERVKKLAWFLSRTLFIKVAIFFYFFYKLSELWTRVVMSGACSCVA